MIESALIEGFLRWKSDGLMFPYGTAGFRGLATSMHHVMHRCALLAVLRSMDGGNQAVGICVTASHNPACDNGVKLTDPSGGMLCPEFEKHAVNFINSEDPLECFRSIAARLGFDLNNKSTFSKAVVVLGRDTRESSPEFATIVCEGVASLGATCYDLEVATTPQLHFAVWQTNLKKRIVTLSDYYDYFGSQIKDFQELSGVRQGLRFMEERLVCDCANGVGANGIEGFRDCLKTYLNVNLCIRNNGKWPGDILNENVGAEYVQKEHSLPKRFGPEFYDPMFQRCCAFDGDADRLVYFSTGLSGELLLLDGDKIASLYNLTVSSMLKVIHSECPKSASNPLRLATVQTAYANGASTRFIETCLPKHLEDLEFDVVCVKTGVKNLHRKAETYDVAIYFESNGHGTIMANFDRLRRWAADKGCMMLKSFLLLEKYLLIFNNATGDAMTDLLAVELSLRYLGMSFMEWIKLYCDLPCVQRKVPMRRLVLDRLETHSEHEKVLVSEACVSIQKRIDDIVAQYRNARAFVRPSGTENVARIFAEAESLNQATMMANEIQIVLERFANSLA